MSAGVEQAQSALIRALDPLAAPFSLWSIRSRRWASATFDGARHRLVLALEGEETAARADRLEAVLAEAELDIVGGFVADIGVERRLEGGAIVLEIEALTIRDAGVVATISRAVRRAG